jgi:hypothetical protein
MAKLKGGTGDGEGGEGQDAQAQAALPAQQPELRPLGRQVHSSGAAEFEEILPELSGGTRERDPFPKVPAQSPFYLVYTPDRWDVIEGQLVPSLYKLSLTPGANAVTRGAGGRPDPTDAIAGVERQGHYLLPWDIGGEGRYIRAFQVGTGQDRKTGAAVKIYSWHTRWEQLYAGSDAIQSDTAGYAAWLVGLIERGLLPRPRPYVVERLRRQYETALHKRLGKTGDDALCQEYKRRIKACVIEQERQAAASAPVRSEDLAPELAT